MPSRHTKFALPNSLKLGMVAIVFTVGVVVLMLWLAGRFSPKVPMDILTTTATPGTMPATVPVRSLRIPVTEAAVGTIRAVHETTIASRLLSRVIEVNLKAGQTVKKGDVLVRLDSEDLKARLQQAEAQVTSAQALKEQAGLDERRMAQVLQQNAATVNECERARSVLRAAEAEVTRAQQSVREMQANLDYATMTAQMDAVIIDKKVDVGDTVVPGQTLLTLYDPGRMQLIASVRESLAHRLSVGQNINVMVEGVNKTSIGQISEIVPEAQSASRTFQVKVTSTFPSNVYTGMFGRIIIPLDEEDVLVIPQNAMRKVGQLELVEVLEHGQLHRRAILAGRVMGDDVEVLSGLHTGEQVAAPANPPGQGI